MDIPSIVMILLFSFSYLVDIAPAPRTSMSPIRDQRRSRNCLNSGHSLWGLLLDTVGDICRVRKVAKGYSSVINIYKHLLIREIDCLDNLEHDQLSTFFYFFFDGAEGISDLLRLMWR